MTNRAIAFSLPRWKITQWLLHAGKDVPDDIRAELVASLFGTLPIFAGGVLNTIAVSLVIALRHPAPLFIGWVILEVVLCFVRLALLTHAYRAAREGRRTPTDWYVTLGVLWGASVGYGAFVCLLSGDWVAASLSCLSAAAMVGGICFRNFGAPRLVAVMIISSLGPCCPAAALSGQPIMLLTLLQIPFYVTAMTIAAFRLNKLLVSTMKAERENDRRARHDPLTGLPNRAGLLHAVESLPAASAHGRRDTALLYLDLDGFKPVNDQYGHAVGDALLVAVAVRLRGAVRQNDLVARIGGDEFVVLAHIPRGKAVSALADALIDTISAPYLLGPGMNIDVSASIGIAFVEGDARELNEALRKADTALYLAKASGKMRWSLAA